MSLLSRGTDTFYAYRFLRLLVTSWDKLPAFKLGLIGADGSRIRKPVTSEEKAAYTYFHRLVFNIKRLLAKAPGGKTRLGSFVAALYLIRENKGCGDNFSRIVLERLGIDQNSEPVNEWFTNDQREINTGVYSIVSEALPIISTGDVVNLRGKTIYIKENLAPFTTYLGHPLYKYNHPALKQEILFTNKDIRL